MLKVAIITLLLASGSAGAAFASEEDSVREAAAALKAPPSEVRSDEDQARARSSMAWNNAFAAANLMEQADAGASTVMTRFNLATAYQRTGRLTEAAALYRGLIRDGQYTTGILDPDYAAPRQRSRGINIADESAARLSVLDRLAANRQASLGQPFSASEAGTNVAAVEGVSNRPRISDDEALARDAAARAARLSRTTP